MEIGYVLNHRYIEATSQNVILQYCGVAGENIVVRSTENFRPECWKSCVYNKLARRIWPGPNFEIQLIFVEFN
jgi:hypothetical protein